jgi:serine protease SohB
MFLAKVATIVIAIIAIIVAGAVSASRQKHKKGELEINDLTAQYQEVKEHITHQLLTKDELKAKEKADKQKAKDEKKAKKEAPDAEQTDKKHKVFVIDFKGSIDAREVESLREEVSAVLSVATQKDEVFVRLESGGGMVHGYGLASSQLDRIRKKDIPLTVAIDKVAASGGYMMACVANKILSAPFAIVGSIGVIAQLPNFNKVLKKHDVDFEQLTAGEYKRTLTMFGENTDKARAKFVEELEETHDLFKTFVAEHRPSLEIGKVATGEHWFGSKAKELGLVDEILTSDDYLQAQSELHKIVQIKYVVRKGLAEKFAFAASLSVDRVFGKLLQKNTVYPG